MRNPFAIAAAAMVAGIGIGGFGVHSLKAQGNMPVI
jgi:hypothetical protein